MPHALKEFNRNQAEAFVSIGCTAEDIARVLRGRPPSLEITFVDANGNRCDDIEPITLTPPPMPRTLGRPN